MFCAQCGQRIADGAKFCSHCGAAAPTPVAASPTPVAPAPPVGRGAKPAKLEWHLGDKVRVRAERIDPMRKRVEFALVAGT